MIEKNPSQTIPSAEDGSPLTKLGPDGKQGVSIVPDIDTRDALQVLCSIEALLIRQVWMQETYYDTDSSQITRNDIVT